MSDEVGQEYFAGLLLSSGSDGADADDGVYYAGIVAGLTSNQIRLHHAIYRCFASNVAEYPESNEAKGKNAVWMSLDDAAGLINIIEGDDPLEVVSESLEALNQRGLVDLGGVSTPKLFADIGIVTAIPSCVTIATDMGIRLFLRAYGIRTSDAKRMFEFDWSQPDSLGEIATSAFVGPYDKGFPPSGSSASKGD
ncbi:hypothetical protein [Arthrobacter sp. K5]|uniref:Uncharacterized protein n=1 Tax=Arthrobacter sp. K5 TaxID=2839623 RepID=A0AAU8EW20_9MICC